MQKVSEYYDVIVHEPISELAKISENPDVEDKQSVSYREAKELKEEIRSIKSWQRQCEKNSTMTNALTIAGRQPDMSVSILETDDNPMMLGVLNGVVDIETGELLTDKQAREAFVMQSCGVKYDPDASIDDWGKMVLRIACGDKELATTMQMVFGRVLIGRNSDHFWFLYGSGNNGKTTMLDLIDMILGDYAVIGNPDMFVPSNRTPKEYYYAGWKGKRYITFNETKKEMVSLSEEIIKQTTDAPKLNARHPGGKAFEFTPQFTPFFSVNHLPAVSNDEAVWRRIKIIPFNYSIPKNLKDGGFKERMFRDNGSGILNWLIEGARMYMENGNKMYICDTVEKFTRLMKQDTDKMGMFLLEFVGEHGTPERILGTDLLAKYSEWSSMRNYKSLGIKNFYVELVAAGLEKKVGRANKTYIYGFAEWSVKNNPAHREKDSTDGKRENITKLVTL